MTQFLITGFLVAFCRYSVDSLKSDVTSLLKKISTISEEMNKADPQFKQQMEGFVMVRDTRHAS